ncbi:MAG: hypothetical protein AAF993_15550, partial [Pseudomonadota bacterium]
VRQSYARDQRRAERRSDQTEQRVKRLPALYSLATQQPDKTLLAHYDVNKRLLREIAARCAEEGAEFLLVNIPFVYHPQQVEELRNINATFDPRYFDRDLGAFAEAEYMHYLGLQAPFEDRLSQTGESLNWGKWNQGHWNYAGHRLVADLLQERIQQLTALQPSTAAQQHGSN